MNPKKCRTIFDRFSKHNDHPVTELHYSTVYELLTAVMLSAQMTDKGVNLATAKLFPLANTPQEILNLGEEKLTSLIKNVNYYKTKARHIINTAQILLSDFQGTVPDTRENLEKLPGVGRKTANVILNAAFQQPVIAVDTHIFRVANRTGLAAGKTPREVEDNLLKIIPKKFLLKAHHWLVLHGRYICTAYRPKCSVCIIKDLCEFKNKIL